MAWMIFIKVLKNTIQIKKHKILITFDMINMLSNNKLNPIVTELFIRGKKLNIPVFITQSYFAVPKNVRLNSPCHSLSKFQTNENFNKLHLIIQQILTLKTL